jgi:hypothetical protein
MMQIGAWELTLCAEWQIDSQVGSGKNVVGIGGGYKKRR